MKTVLGEYGKIIILVILLSGLLVFLFGRREKDFLGLLSVTKPREMLGKKDNFMLSQDILQRRRPTLFVKVKKLKKGQSYNMLDSGTFLLDAKNEDGKEVIISLVKLVDPEQKDITDQIHEKSFVPQKIGKYCISYRAEEVYKGSVKAVEQQYCFLVN